MKKLSLLLFSLFYIGIVSAQKIQLINGHTTNLSPDYTRAEGNKFDTVHIHIRLTGPYDADSNTVTFNLRKMNLPNNPRLVSNTLIFTEDAWPAETESKDTLIILSLLMDRIKDTLKNDEIGHLIIEGHPDNYHTIRLTNTALAINTSYNPTKPFWVEVGSNFDLIDGLEPNNFFAGVFFHKRDVRPFRYRDSVKIKEWLARNKPATADTSRRYRKLMKLNFGDSRFVRNNNLGAFAGIFESKTITNTTDQNFSIRQYYDSTSFIPDVADSIKIFTGIGNATTKRVVKNVSLFFSPQLRLSRNTANADGLHFFTSVWAELQWQKIVEEAGFSQIRIQKDTVISINRIDEYRASNSLKETDVRSHYFGIGLPIYFRETTTQDDLVQLLINPVFGWTNQPTMKYLDEVAFADGKGLPPPNRPWNPFYIVQFRLNEEKYGIAFTGELRGIIRNNNQPYVSLALTKKFDLTKFIEYSK